MDVLGDIVFSKHQSLMVLKTCDVLSCSLGYLSLHPKYNQNTMQSYPNLKQNYN
jgi:CO dehydrogenase/acetyl-CoA synthase epsilon subunit